MCPLNQRYCKKVGDQAGATYLMVLLIVALLSAGLARVAQAWSAEQKRDKEVELLFIGQQYRQAIASYYQATPGPVKRFPRDLDDLLLDNRSAAPLRHLRKRYRDPISTEDWVLIPAPDGGVMGIHSASKEPPIKRANFAAAERTFAGAESYAQWQFVYLPGEFIVPLRAR